jgi:hypothetical protein
VTKDSYYQIQLTERDALSNNPPPEYYIHAIPDQPPALTISRPGRDIKATMVEEVPVHITVEEDYGTPTARLLFSVNGGSEKSKPLVLEKKQAGSASDALEFSAEHLFYLEDFDLQPGDFVSYYIKAQGLGGRDAAATAVSEIYFVEIRPFTATFFRPLSEQQMAGGGNNGNQLSKTQKEIVIAIWKLQQNKETMEASAFTERTGNIAETQQNLQEITSQILFQLQQRNIFTNEASGNVVTYYKNALDAMRRAHAELSKADLAAALGPARSALQQLLRAEAEVTEFNMQRGAGGGSDASLEQLSELFEQEMDKLKSKYETLNQSQPKQQQEDVDEALRNVRELARRQQQSNRQLRDLARQQMPEEDRQRQIEELRRQQEQLQRDARDLTTQMQRNQQQDTSLPRDAQDELRRATGEMSSASSSLRRDNTELAAARGARALDRLRRLEQMLQKNQKDALRKQLNDVDQDLQRVAQGQQQLSEQVRQLQQNASSPDTSGRAQQIAGAQDRQERLKQAYNDVQQQIDDLAEATRRSQDDFGRGMRDLKRQADNAAVERKMEQAKQMLQKRQLNSAARAEQDIENALQRMTEELVTLRSKVAESDEEKMDLALEQTRRMREDLESLQRETQGIDRQTKGQQSEGRTSGQRAGPGETRQRPSEMNAENARRWNEQLARSMQDLEFVQRSMAVDSSLSGQLSQLEDNWHGVIRNFSGAGAQDRFQLIEQYVLDPLRQIEAEMAQKLELVKNKEKLFLAREERIPSEYQELVEKYYERLSETQ